MSVCPEKSLAEKIGQAKGWDDKVMILSDYHGLPDFRTRRGLKQIHKTFDDVTNQLDSTYDDHAGNDDVRIALAVLWGLICTDYVLENKLVSRGLLLKLRSFVKREDSRTLAMCVLLRMVIHHGPPRWELMRTLYPVLANVFRTALDDEDAPTLKALLHILSHSADVTMYYNEGVDKSLQIDLDLDEILAFYPAALRVPAIPHHFTYVLLLNLLHTAVTKTSAIPIIFRQSSVLSLLVAGIWRSYETFDRLQVFTVFVTLHRSERQPRPDFDVPYAWDFLQNKLGHEEKAPVIQFGLERSEACQAATARNEFIDAVSSHFAAPDILTCARAIFRSILRYPGGAFSATVPCWIGAPIRDYLDILPICSVALREAGPSTRDNLDAADVLELRYHHQRNNMETAHTTARRAMQRSPKEGFFYCMAALTCPDLKEALSIAKLGLETSPEPGTSWHVRLWLHQVAADVGLNIAMMTIRDHFRKGDKLGTVDDCISLLLDVVKHSRAYSSLAPPDTFGLKEMIAFEMIAILTLCGRELDTELGGIKHLLDRYRAADRLSNLLHKNPELPFMERTLKTFLDKYQAAYTEWEPTLAKTIFIPGQRDYRPSGAPGSTVHILTSLPEDISGEIWDGGNQSANDRFPKTSQQTLFRCARCHNPCAALRKCSRCHRVAYCSVDCQKADWKGENGDGHKQKCIRLV